MEHSDWVMVDFLKKPCVDVVEQVYGVIIPGTPDVVGKLVEAMEVLGISWVH